MLTTGSIDSPKGRASGQLLSLSNWLLPESMAMLEKEHASRSEGDNGSSDQLHLTKALEPKPVEFAFSFVRNIPHHARLGGGDHERQLLVSFEMFVVVKE